MRTPFVISQVWKLSNTHAYQVKSVVAFTESAAVLERFSLKYCSLLVVVWTRGPERVNVKELVSKAEAVAFLVRVVAVIRRLLTQVIERGVRSS